MEDFHILTQTEVSAIYQARIKHYQALADTYISEKWGKIENAPRFIRQQLLQLLATTDKYNGTPDVETLLTSPYWLKLPDDEIKGVIGYHIKQLKYNDSVLNGTIASGKSIRGEVEPTYPSLFQGNERVYIRLPLIQSHPTQISGIVHEFNTCLPTGQKLDFQTVKTTDTSYYISDKKNSQHLGVFLGRKIKALDNFSAQLATKTPEAQQQLVHQIQTRDFYQYDEQNGHPLKIDWLKREHHIELDSLLYLYVQQKLKKSPHTLSEIITSTRDRFFQLKKSITFEQDRQGSDEYDALEHDTDMIILSKDPHDIAWCSAYTDYESFSCMNPCGYMHQYVSEDIGRGSLVAYMINSQNPLKRHSRILLKPYFNKYGESIYYVGKTHGEKNYVFDRFLREFARDYLNCPRTETYTIEKHLYPDSEPEQIVYSRLLENTR